MTEAALDGQRGDLDREWGLNAVRVLRAPRWVFRAFRDTGREADAARSEPVLGLSILAGMAGILLTPEAGTLLDPSEGRLSDPAVPGAADALIWTFIAGGLLGVALYWVAGWLYFVGARSLGGTRGFRQARQLFAYAAAPLAFSVLLVLPVRLVAFGFDIYRSNGDDSGSVGTVLALAPYALIAWSVGLLLLGTLIVNRWPWWRASAAVVLALALIGGLVAVGQLG